MILTHTGIFWFDLINFISQNNYFLNRILKVKWSKTESCNEVQLFLQYFCLEILVLILTVSQFYFRKIL